MRKVTTFIALIVCVLAVHAQAGKNLEKVKTLDRTIETLYGVISGEAGVKRDWELFKYLFTADARLIPSGPNKEGQIGYQAITPEGYIERSGNYLEENGFFEQEIYRITETFGNVTHIFSTYEARRKLNDEQPFMRGINSIQLLNDGERWWVMTIYWTQESEANPIPKKYLPK